MHCSYLFMYHSIYIYSHELLRALLRNNADWGTFGEFLALACKDVKTFSNIESIYRHM